MPTSNASDSLSFLKYHSTPSHMASRPLSCGVSRIRLSQFYDYYQGAGDALAPLKANELARHVHQCNQCQLFIAHCEYLRSHLHGLYERTISEANSDLNWLDTILHMSSLEGSRGKTFPIKHHACDSLGISEGALRALVRRNGSCADLVVASTDIRLLRTDQTHPQIQLAFNVTTYVRHGVRIPIVVDAARKRISQSLVNRTNLHIHSINFHVSDIFLDDFCSNTTVKMQ
ncbi:MAG: hypothetical protein Q4P66_07225 [Actinomycetaceae bacterium]|nr:hypothetical protein [Actinomycetaceae bacterium]